MILVDLVAAASAAASSACLALRANMLKPMFAEWHSAPRPVWLSMMASSLLCGLFAVWMLDSRNHVPVMVAAVLAAQAVCSAVMLLNLVRQTRNARQADGVAP